MRKSHHLPHKYEVVVPVGDARPGLWEVGHNWHDRIPLITPFEFVGDLGVLFDAIGFAASTTSRISATFGQVRQLDINSQHTARMVDAGREELSILHAMLLRSLDRINQSNEPRNPMSQMAIRFSNGRAIGEGYVPHVMRPSQHGYEFERSLGIVVLMQHIDAKSHAVPLKVFELVE